MIKAVIPGPSTTGPSLVIGLSGEDVTRLVANEPIWFKAADLGLQRMQVIVIYGRTDPVIETYLRSFGVAIRSDRCPSCDHLWSIHQPEGCWYTVTAGQIDQNLGCPCSVPAPA